MTLVTDFLTSVTETHASGIATEHSYRPALQKLINGFERDITALNEPKRIDVGAPDLIVQRKGIALGYVEAKDLHIGLRGMKDANKAQQQRYLKALPNLIYTNCLDWDFYRDGELYASVTVADFLMGIQPRADQFDVLENLLRDFLAQRPQTITSPKVLAEIMAGKAALIKDVLNNTLKADAGLQSELAGQFKAFREHLIHDITAEDFADIYAETIAYGMFAARLHDHTLETFSRQEALDLLPKSNPFLRSLFSYIAGPDLDDRIRWIIDDLANVFQAADVKKIMAGFGELTGRKDPFLHFYETFLAAYNPAKRKARGVWYTPEAVVNFIVRAVDEVLQTEFGLPLGLADTSKVTIDWETGQTDKKGKPETIKKEVHRVQILDPATGTGTFLAEVIKQIAPKITGVAPGMWSSYIEKDLIPRLHGFELLMASYAMCHMKLDMILAEMGYKPTGSPPRLSVYLTNSLEEGEPANQALPFAQWLSNEVKAANTIKRDMPIMCVIGNPPYSGESANKGDWIMGLMEAYKKEPGGKEKLKERNPKWINDDYVKFIRFSEHLIEKNGEGVLGFITNHGYLDNPTFRGMRWHLMKTFDKIYVLDLHGNSKKKEVTPEGKPDKNVFDIMQGVAIIIGVKRKAATEEKPLAEVFHGEMWGSRDKKYESLWNKRLTLGDFQKIELSNAQNYFMPLTSREGSAYYQFVPLNEFFPLTLLGPNSHRDNFAIAFDFETARSRMDYFFDKSNSDNAVKEKFNLKDNRDWKINSARKKLPVRNFPIPCLYRPFDRRFMLYGDYAFDYPRSVINDNMISTGNIAMISTRQTKERFGIFCSNLALGQHKIATPYDGSYVSPLYLHPADGELDQSRRVNFDPKLFKQLQDRVTQNAQIDNLGDSPPPPAISGRDCGVRLYLRRPALPGLSGNLCRIPQDRLPAHSVAA